jgi:hypothetical protein
MLSCFHCCDDSRVNFSREDSLDKGKRAPMSAELLDHPSTTPHL